jgi:TM2 domain-containing membrane protein YozV
MADVFPASIIFSSQCSGMIMSMVFCRGCGTSIHETAISCPKCGAQQNAGPINGNIKSQTVAAVLAAFLGGIGIHRFYLRKYVTGVCYVLLCWTGLPSLFAFFETIIIAFMSPSTWAAKYNGGRLSEPVHVAVKIAILIIPTLAMIGILAAIAIPAYHNYTEKARAAQTSFNAVPHQKSQSALTVWTA